MIQARLIMTLLLAYSAAGESLRGGRGLIESADSSCQVAVNTVAGTGSIKVDPDQLVINAELKSAIHDQVGKAGKSLKALVDNAGIEGVKYSQTFSQESNYDNKLNKNVKGDWRATITITVPIKADEWDATGSSTISSLISKVLALKDSAIEKNRKDKGKKGQKEEGRFLLSDSPYPNETYDQSSYPSYPSPSVSPSLGVSITSTYFSVSDSLRKSTEQKALGLAVTDAIENIKQSAMPWLSNFAAVSFGPKSLTEVKISTNGGGGNAYFGGIARPTASMMMNSADAGSGNSADDVGVDLTYVFPSKQTISQTATVSACVVA